MTIWSYLPWALPPLPALPSFLNLSLPPNLQKRFVSYLLKRSLGRFVKGGGLDVEKVEGQISQGRLELDKLELDIEAINKLIDADLSLQLRSGQINQTSVQIPIRNLWSDSLSLDVSSIDLDFDIVPTLHASGGNDTHADIPDLTASVASVAQEFLSSEVDAYEGADLARSIRESLVLSPPQMQVRHSDDEVEDPFISPQSVAESDRIAPGGFPFVSAGDAVSGGSQSIPSSSVLAGLVERVLSRLQVCIGSVNVRLHFRYGCGADDEREIAAAWFDLKLDMLSYMNETTSDGNNSDTFTTSKVIRLASAGLRMTREAPMTVGAEEAVPDAATTRDRRRSASTGSTASLRTLSPKLHGRGNSSASETSSGGDIDEATDMMMSQAIADLRESQAGPPSLHASQLPPLPGLGPLGESVVDLEQRATLSDDETASSLSLYASALEGTIGPESQPTTLRGQRTKDSEIDAITSAPPDQDEEAGSHFAGTDVAFSGRKRRSAWVFVTSQETSVRLSSRRETKIQIDIGTSAGLLLPWQISTLQQMAAVCSSGATNSNMEGDRTMESIPGRSSPVVSVELKIPSLTVALGHTSSMEAEADSLLLWQPHPKLNLDCLEVRVSDTRMQLVAGDATQPDGDGSPQLSVTVKDIAVNEHLVAYQKQDVQILTFAKPSTVQGNENVCSCAADHSARQGGKPVDWPEIHLPPPLSRSKDASTRAEENNLAHQSCAGETTKADALCLVHKDAESGWDVSVRPLSINLDFSTAARLATLVELVASVDPRRSQETVSLHVPTVPRSQDQQASPSPDRQSPAVVPLRFQMQNIRCDVKWPTSHPLPPLVILDMVNLVIFRSRDSSEFVGPTWTGEFERLLLFSPSDGDDKATAFLAVSSLKEDDPSAPAPRQPGFRIGYKAAPKGFYQAGLGCQVEIPSVQARLDETTLHSLQYLADDLSRWSARRQAAPMGGSHSFENQSVKETAIPAGMVHTLGLSVTEFDVFFIPPAAEATHEPSVVGVVVLSASDTGLSMTAQADRSQKLMDVEVSVDNVTLAQVDQRNGREVVCHRQPRTSSTTSSQPVICLKVSSVERLDAGRKETRVAFRSTSLSHSVDPQSAWIKAMTSLFKAPPGIFENVEPSEVTAISLHMDDALILLPALGRDGALFLRLDNFSASTNALAGVDQSITDIKAGSIDVLASDQKARTLEAILLQRSIRDLAGDFAVDICPILSLEELAVRLETASDDVETDASVQIAIADIRMAVCADSAATIASVVTDIAASWQPSSSARGGISVVASYPPTNNLLGSIDETAFTRLAPQLSDGELISDDIPTNASYLQRYDSRPRQRHKDSLLPSGLSEPYGTFEEVKTNDNPDSRIRILHPEPIRLPGNYWKKRRPSVIPVHQTLLRVKVEIARGKFLLYDGYDWTITRKTIEAEMKAIKRKLQKFKQILASGQTPDESVEVTRTWLYDSVLIGLPEEDLGGDPDTLLAAIENQLEHLDIDTASISPSAPATTRLRDPKTSGGAAHKRRRKLERSSRPQIEISLAGIRIDHTHFKPPAQERARSVIAVANLEIFDHIKTSTWKKFLTHMALSQGQAPETDVDMVQIRVMEMVNEQTGREKQQEYRIKVEIQPLRLHIDQDALDFIKRFFAFQDSSQRSTGEGMKPPQSQAYLQHVDILPVRIKLDYKPKRVDVRALRSGKTMELMNFFHFEGAEMTLRRVMLSGISGFSTLYDALNDIWAPDVKANQLADVLAGVTPLRSVVNVGSGMADLVLLPLENFRQDGRISRGLQRGAKSFAKTTALEALRLGANLAAGTQVILEKAEHALGPRNIEDGSSGGLGDFANAEEQSIMVTPASKYAQQPESVKAGLSAAYQSLSSNLTQAAQTILAVPMEIHERSENGTVRAVVRAIPVAFLKSGIGATEAVSKTLFGIRNELDPTIAGELSDKYK